MVTWVLNRPAERNTLSAGMRDGMASALVAFERDRSARVLVIRGAGSHFCAGGDVKALSAGEASRMLGLSLLNVVLETGGRQISACPPLVAVIQHDLSRNLLQNSRTSNLQILSLTLRVVFNMFNSVREHMKVQLEVFFNSIHLAESSLPETREMALESLVEALKFLPDLTGLNLRRASDLYLIF